MKKFNSFSKAKQFVKLFLEGTFGEKSLVINDFNIDMKGIRGKDLNGCNLYLAIRKNGTQGVYIHPERAYASIKTWADPYAVCEFSYIQEEKIYTVKLNKINR